jgi:hypothetical protein
MNNLLLVARPRKRRTSKNASDTITTCVGNTVHHQDALTGGPIREKAASPHQRVPHLRHGSLRIELEL